MPAEPLLVALAEAEVLDAVDPPEVVAAPDVDASVPVDDPDPEED